MDQSGHHILIVDDIFLNIHLLDNFLRKEGYDFSSTTQGEEVFEIVRREDIDLILLDIMLPGMDGYQICRKLKSDPQTKDIPIIFLTAKAEKADIVRGFECGAVDYILKPFNSAELTVRIKTHLELKEARKMANYYADRLAETNERLMAQDQLIRENALEIANLKKMLCTYEDCGGRITEGRSTAA